METPNIAVITIDNENMIGGMPSLMHKHPNANELVYCISGEGTIVFMDGSDSEELTKGAVVFLEKDQFHHIMNLGQEDLKLWLTFDNDDRETVNF